MAKRLDSRYEPGARSGAWVKIKNHRTATYTVGGWIPDEDGRVGSLLIGTSNGAGGLQYVGAVELGPLNALRPALDALSRSTAAFAAFRSKCARWVEPTLSIRVRSLDTADRWLREATFLPSS